jgi:hypothetical protein
MESSRDSSVWRSLAVTFGGGLALGAVGMKLTQTALRPAEVAPRPESNVLTDRLSSMEKRLERVEHTPAPPRPAAPAPAPAAPVTAVPTAAIPIDQKVLEAVIGAVDARLHEHAGQVERRLADMEARLAVNGQRDHQIEHQLRQEAVALRTKTEQELSQMRESLARTVTVQTAMHAEVQTLRQQNEHLVDAIDQRFDDMRQDYSQQVADVRENFSQAFEAQAAAQEKRLDQLQQSMEARMVNAATVAAVDRVDQQLAPLRAEIHQKEQELAELRQRLADSEQSVLDVIMAVGAACRQAADRISAPREQPPAAPPAPPTVAAPVTTEAVAEPLAAEPGDTPELAPDVEPKPIQSVPDFLNGTARRTASWRIPLVSSVLVSTGYFVLMHFLSAPLQ